MRNYARFQDKIDVSRAILVIKYLTCLVGNSFKASIKNDMLDFNVIKFFGINTRTGKVLRPLPIRWEFPSSSRVKINTNGATRGYPVHRESFYLYNRLQSILFLEFIINGYSLPMYHFF